MFDLGRIPRGHRGITRVTEKNCERILGALWPGDVIMKWQDGSVVSNIIVHAQKRYGYPPRSPEITHVSMYVGDASVFHATYSMFDKSSSMTRKQAFSDYYMGHNICVGRPFANELSRTATVRTRLVEECAIAVGQPYNLAIVAVGELMGSPFGHAVASMPEEVTEKLRENLKTGQICSTALYAVFLKVMGQNNPVKLGICDSGPYIMPADFFVSPELAPVEL